MRFRAPWLSRVSPLALVLGCGPSGGVDTDVGGTATTGASTGPTTSTSSAGPTTTTTSSTSTTVDETTTSSTTTTTTTNTTSTTATTTTTGDETTDTTIDSDGSGSSGGPVHVFTPLSLEVADFDADGDNDLLVMGVDTIDGIVGRFSHGLGDGSFAAPFDPELAGTSAFPVIGQFDNAEGTDVMVAGVGDMAEVFRWSQDQFVSWKVFTGLFTPRTHVVADSDGDGDDDILWLWWDNNNTEFGVSVRPNGGGFFFAPVHTDIGVISDVDLAASSLLVGRLDGDSSADALVFEADKAKGFLRLFGTPAGLFGNAAFVLPTLRPWVATLGDFDEDGALDILAVERMPARLILAAGDGSGGFAVKTTINVAAPFRPFTIDIADLDGDNHLDIAAVDDQTPEVWIWTGKGDGSFNAPKSSPLPSPAVRVHAALLDGDDVFDLAVATFEAGDVTVILGP